MRQKLTGIIDIKEIIISNLWRRYWSKVVSRTCRVSFNVLVRGKLLRIWTLYRQNYI